MAPEPYPQEKWTREQEKAYAEGRKSARGTQEGPSRSGRKRRVVRTDAGARRYGVPIGAEIGSARNAKAAEAQKDTESRDRYEALVGQDPQAQAAVMRGLDDGQLKRLTQVAYSWRSSDPHVVRLRVGVANELRRRGFNVNDFGGLGGGNAQPAKPKARVPSKKRLARPAAVPVQKGRVRSAMTARRNDRKLRELSVPQLRQALGAFSRIPPKKREPVARFLVRQAIELSATNMIGRSVVEAANLPQQEAIELAGKWKHGWIPLDSVALRSKMKGGNGKPWWSGGKQSRRGSAATMRRTLEGKRIQEQRRAGRGGSPIPRNKPSNNKEVTKVTGGKPKPFVAVPKQGGQRRVVTTEEIPFKGSGKTIPGTRRIGPAAGGNFGNDIPKPRKDFVNNKDTRQKYAAIRISPEGRKKIADAEAKQAARKAKSSAVRKTRQAEVDAASNKYYSSLSKDQLKAEIQQYADHPGMLADASDKERLDRLRAEWQKRRGILPGTRTGVVKSSSKPNERGSKMNTTKTSPATEPFPAAASYLQKHGAEKTREKLAELKQRRADLKSARRKTTSVDMEIRGLENVLARNS